jgi:hypothetical protein
MTHPAVEFTLTPPEARAVGHLLTHSALGCCVGVPGRFVLHDRVLTVADVDEWSWSGGERVLIDVLLHLLGEGRWPDVTVLDERNQLIVREAVRLLVTGREQQFARLAQAVKEA